jgi:N-acetylglucosaminyldiphosphoundecaprenol N-acetyl-beta-D-mannosaminyltransferase
MEMPNIIMNKKIEFLSLCFDKYDSVEELANLVLNSNSFLWIVTPNVDHVVRFHKSKIFADCYKKANITINDSNILNLLSKVNKVDLGCVIPGSDLTKCIMESKQIIDKSICIIGCSEDTVDVIHSKYKIKTINHYNPPMGFINSDMEVQRCVDFIVNSNCDLIFLCVGSPRQEFLAEKLIGKNVNSPILCVGASFLFLSGEEKRAPEIIRDFSLEWAYRLFQNPRRLAKRYLLDGPQIFFIFLKYLFNVRFKG